MVWEPRISIGSDDWRIVQEMTASGSECHIKKQVGAATAPPCPILRTAAVAGLAAPTQQRAPMC